MKKFLIFLLTAAGVFAASSPDVGLRPSTSWAASNIMAATNASQASSAIVATRTNSIVYPTGALIQDADSNGVPRLWRGDGSTAGGVLIGGQTTTYSPTETFARASSAIDPIDGTVFASGMKATRTIRYLPSTAWIWEGSSGTNSMAAVTSAGTFLAYGSGGTVWRSTDRGDTWSLVKSYGTTFSGFMVRTIPSSSGGQIIFACASYGSTKQLNASFDDGATWSTNLLTSDEQAAFAGTYQPFFSSDISIERLAGVTVANSRIRLASYGSWIDRVTGSQQVSGRIFRSEKTVAELEAGAVSLDFRKVWQVDPSDYYVGAFAHDTALLQTNGTLVSATSTNVVIPDAALVSTSTLPVLKITSGAGSGQVRAITSKSGTTINIASAFSVTPSAGDSFVISGLPTLNNGAHMHATTLDTNRNELWVCLGDNDESHSVLVVTNWSNLTGASLAGEVPEQPVNWNYTSEPFRTGDQPTSLYWTGDKVVAPTTDWLDPRAYTITPSTRAQTSTLWDFLRPATEYRNLVKGWDAAQFDTNLYVFHQAVAGGIVGGIYVGDLTQLDGVTRITISNDVHYGLASSGNYYGAMTDAGSSNVVAYIPSLLSTTATFLGRNWTNLLSNADFASTTGTAPTQRPTGTTASASGVNYWVTNGPTPFAACNMLHMEWASGSPTPSFYYSVSIPSNQVFEFAFYGRNVGQTNKNQNYFSADYRLYSGATPLGSGIVSGGNCNKLLSGEWQRVSARFTNDLGADTVRVYMRSQKLQYAQTMDWALPTLVVGGQEIMWHSVPVVSTKLAESLRYTVTNFDTGTVPVNSRVAVLVRPYCESGDDVARTENILSIESSGTGDRAKLQWVDDASGNKTFRFVTYDSSGTVRRTRDMGSIHHSHFDTLRIAVEWRNNSLRCTVSVPGGNQSLSFQQPWLRNWRPHTIALGEDYWDATGKRFPGWYNLESVSTTQLF